MAGLMLPPVVIFAVASIGWEILPVVVVVVVVVAIGGKALLLRCPVNNPAFKPAEAVSCNAWACSGSKEEMSYTTPADTGGTIAGTEGGFCGTTTAGAIGFVAADDSLDLPSLLAVVLAVLAAALLILC